jgi:hypothetical protein
MCPVLGLVWVNRLDKTSTATQPSNRLHAKKRPGKASGEKRAEALTAKAALLSRYPRCRCRGSGGPASTSWAANPVKHGTVRLISPPVPRFPRQRLTTRPQNVRDRPARPAEVGGRREEGCRDARSCHHARRWAGRRRLQRVVPDGVGGDICLRCRGAGGRCGWYPPQQLGRQLGTGAALTGC